MKLLQVGNENSEAKQGNLAKLDSRRLSTKAGGRLEELCVAVRSSGNCLRLCRNSLHSFRPTSWCWQESELRNPM